MDLGFLAAIALFNLLQYFVSRQRPLLVYAAAVTSALLALVTQSFVHVLFGWLYFATCAYFAHDFLELPDYDPKLDRTILVLIALSSLNLIAAFFPGHATWIDEATFALLILLLLAILIAGARAARRGYRGARFFVVGSAGAFAGICANTVVETLAIPSVDLSALGVAWQALWFTAALADRANEIAHEHEGEDAEVSRAELQVLAELDPLTGIPNRRAFDDHLQLEWARALRAGTSLGVIMIDVDHFKEYNDTHGHVAGDLCLSKIAQACAASMKRNGDFLARYGGEEFAGILVTQTNDDIALVAERMRVAVGELGMLHPTNPSGIVTISLGVARMQPSPRENPLELVEAADSALYAAKSRGRNQVGTTLPATT